MPRDVQRRSPWPRRFMILTALVIFIVAIVAFVAMSKGNFGLASPLFMSIVVLMLFEFVLMYLGNRY